jgi:hypothetical protein
MKLNYICVFTIIFLFFNSIIVEINANKNKNKNHNKKERFKLKSRNKNKSHSKHRNKFNHKYNNNLENANDNNEKLTPYSNNNHIIRVEKNLHHVKKTEIINLPNVNYGPSTIKQESLQIITTSPMEAKYRRIGDYYPYFYKSHEILFKNHKVNPKEDTNQCNDQECEWCDLSTRSICKICKKGYFINDFKCYTTCPIHRVADIFRRACVDLTTNSKNIYIINI